MRTLSDFDLHLFAEGSHHRLHEKFGAHLGKRDGAEGAWFAVWAPNAEHVSVIGEFNGWNPFANPMERRNSRGVWEGFVAGVWRGALYKYRITGPKGTHDKADPFALRAELPPGTASAIWDLGYEWSDRDWMSARRKSPDVPMAIYEVHLGSWRRVPEEGGRPLSYEEAGSRLAEYVNEMGFTHVEFLPLIEHPYYGSWGYHGTSMFAPTGRYGTPQELMSMIDRLHRNGIGVILDWAPAHFATDEHGLALFDGTPLYEGGYSLHPEWGSYVFDYSRGEVRSFLLSSATFWLEQYHADGLRVDGVASMLYADPGKLEGENSQGVAFLRQFNEMVHTDAPEAWRIAEESSAWPMVTRPAAFGGLGFDLKWDMGWMHDTLEYMTRDPSERKYIHNRLTFRSLYMFNENYVLPLSHDEVKRGFRSLLEKMPGDDWRKFANLRLLLSYMYAQPGKKLLFMGGEFGQRGEWNPEQSLDWRLLDAAPHAAVRSLAGTLNRLHRSEPALHELDADSVGFEWIDGNDSEHSIISFMRNGRSPEDALIAVFNFTPEPRKNYRVGAPRPGFWKEILNTDAVEYGGSGHGNMGGVEATPIPWHGRRYSVNLTLPPLGGILLKRS